MDKQTELPLKEVLFIEDLKKEVDIQEEGYDRKLDIVKIGDKNFLKNGGLVVKVRGRYFRKVSPLIVKTYSGEYERKNEVVTAYLPNKNKDAEEKIRVSSKEQVVVVDDSKRRYLASQMVKEGDKFYHPYAEFVKTVEGYKLPKTQVNELWPIVYGSESFAKKRSTVKTISGNTILRKDAVKITNMSTIVDMSKPYYPEDHMAYVSNKETDKDLGSLKIIQIFNLHILRQIVDSVTQGEEDRRRGTASPGLNIQGFSLTCVADPSNKKMFSKLTEVSHEKIKAFKEGPLRKFINTLTESGGRSSVISRVRKASSELVMKPEKIKALDRRYFTGDVKVFDEIAEMSENMLKVITKKIKAQIRLSDTDPDENQAIEISTNYRRLGAGHVEINQSKDPIISKTASNVGGLKYTYGVEFETAHGSVGNKFIKSLGWAKVGDRSIGSYEYVTQVLHGDDGMQNIIDGCHHLRESCFVDDECSQHVHIGGWKGNKNVTTPKFGMRFNEAILKIAYHIEDEMFSIVPPNRRPGYRHTATLRPYSEMVFKDGAEKVISSMFFGGAKPDMNASISKFNGSRYKWLNLMYCNTSRYAQTCEFRIWGPTTSAYKSRMHVIISMAIVAFADKYSGRVPKKTSTLTLGQIMDTVLDPNTANEVKHYIEKRKEKFKQFNKKPKTKSK